MRKGAVRWKTGKSLEENGTRGGWSRDWCFSALAACGYGLGDFKTNFFKLTFIYFLRVRKRQSTSRGGAERERGDTESEAGSWL